MARGKPFASIDCETDPFKAGRVPVPFMWGIFRGDTEEYWEFATVEEVIAFVSKRDWTFYAHNGGKFDYHYLRDHINSDDPIMVIAGRLASFKIGSAQFRDSLNLFPNTPLRSFAKEDINYSKLEADARAAYIDEIRRYLRSDCVNLWNVVNAYFTKFGRSLTQAGSSMRYWKKHYPCSFTPQTAAQSTYYREFYYGGRVQCFESGYRKHDFSVIDINCAYPHAMMQKHPISPEGVNIAHLPGDADLGPCLIRLEAVAHGCFPLRAESGELFFPDDETTVREYAITGWELIAALECNAVKIVKIKEIREFDQLVSFAEYITHFYDERKIAKTTGDKVQDIFCKYFMNGLYGKFAADPEKYKEYVITHNETLDRWCNSEHHYQDLKPWGERRLCVRDLPEVKHRYYNVCTAASITGWVRAHLFRALRQCEGVLYCDTDSIAATNIGNLPLGEQLGQWKLEFIGNEFAIAGKKLYAFGGHTMTPTDSLYARDGKKLTNTTEGYKQACKGVKLTPEQIIAVAKGERVIFNPEVPTYSFQRDEPVFISREVKNTCKDIRLVA